MARKIEVSLNTKVQAVSSHNSSRAVEYTKKFLRIADT